MLHSFLQKLFNLAPVTAMPFILDRFGKRYWVNVPLEEEPFEIDLLHRGKWIGYVRLLWDDKKIELADIIVFKPENRSHGVGSAFLQFLLEYAKGKGIEVIYGRMQAVEPYTYGNLADWYEKQGAIVDRNNWDFVFELF